MTKLDRLPTSDQLAYASERLRARRTVALELVLTGEHVEEVARMVFDYCGDDDPTAGEVATQILSYLASRLVEPFVAEPGVTRPRVLSPVAGAV